MPKYRTNVVVPGKELLQMLYWMLDTKIYLYQYHCQIAPDKTSLIESDRQHIEKYYRLYLALRCFLGYSKPNVTLKKAENILSLTENDLFQE